MNRRSDIAIVGGGISGVACAWWLRQLGLSATLIESDTQLGGLIRSRREGGWLTERAASMVLNFSPLVDNMLRQSRAGRLRCDRLPVGQRYLLREEALKPVPERLHRLLLGDLIPWKSRLGLLFEAFRPGPAGDSETVADFIRRRLGQELLDIAIDPYVSAVLACDPEQADADAVLPRLKALERRYGSFTLGMLLKKLLPGRGGMPQQAFGFQGGMQTLVETLADEAGSEILAGHRVEALEPAHHGWRIQLQNKVGAATLHASQLILATPAPVSARLLRHSQPDLGAALAAIDHAPLVQVHLGFDREALARPLRGNGFLAPGKRRHGLRGSLWISNLLPDRAPPDRLLTSNVLGGAMQREAADLDDERLLSLALGDLRKLCGVQGEPQFRRIDRHHPGLPLYHGRYQALTRHLQRLCREQGRLQLCGNYLGGISVRDRLIQARNTALQVAENLRHQPQSRPLPLAAILGVSGP